MASIDRTAYPRFPAQLGDRELDRDYRLSDPERLFVRRQARGDAGRLSLALLLKTRQRLGYFAVLVEIPERVRAHVAKELGLAPATPVVDEVDRPATVHRYRTALREWLGSRPFSHGGRAIVTATVHRAAQTMSDPADLISASVEALVKHQVEVPAFATLDRLIGNLRQEIHEGLYAGIDAALDKDQRRVRDALLVRAGGARLNPFSQMKSTPGPATLKHLREWIQRLADLDAILDPGPLLAGLSHTKVRQFAAEAAAMESGDLRDVCLPGRRHTLLLCLLHQAQSDTRDQLVEMFVRRMRRTQSDAIERLHEVQADHQGIEERLLDLFGQVLRHADAEGDDQDLGRHVRSLLLAQGGVETLAAQLQGVTAYHSDNYFPLLWPIHSVHRSALFSLFDLLDLRSATSDSRLLDAYRIVREHRGSRRAALPVALDLGFASQRWQTFVRERSGEKTLVRRRALELCVFVHLADALKSGDVFVVGSGAFADYRAQLLPWAECVPRLEEYCTAVGLPANATTFVAELRQRLTWLAEQVDAGFADNSELSIDADGTPHLTRLGPQRLPEGLAAFEAAVRERMPERHVLDVLKHAQHWSSFARHFGPPSGRRRQDPRRHPTLGDFAQQSYPAKAGRIRISHLGKLGSRWSRLSMFFIAFLPREIPFS